MIQIDHIINNVDGLHARPIAELADIAKKLGTQIFILKRLGLAQKSLYVVPNHLLEQWGSDFLRLYPGANILVATKKDFEPANRKRFCSRIATGDRKSVV